MAKNADQLAAELGERIGNHTAGVSLRTLIEARELLVDDYKFSGGDEPGEAEDEA